MAEKHWTVERFEKRRWVRRFVIVGDRQPDPGPGYRLVIYDDTRDRSLLHAHQMKPGEIERAKAQFAKRKSA